MTDEHSHKAPDSRVLVITPTYNERDSLPGTAARLHAAAPFADLLVVDDGSPDGTATWVREHARTRPGVHLIARASKSGLGPAYLAGFRWALDEGYDIICEMDADASHRPEQLPRLIEALEQGADVVIGSRWVPGGAVHNWPMRRQLLSRGANAYTALMLGLAVRDATAGFRAFRAQALRQILDNTQIASQGYCFQVDMTRHARARQLEIHEVPIDFDERLAGASKMSGEIVREAMSSITRWGIETRRAQLTTVISRMKNRRSPRE